LHIVKVAVSCNIPARQMGRLLYLVQQLRLLAEKLLTHVLLRSTALRWHWHKLLLTDRNSVVIIYVKLGLRLPFHTSSFLRFQSHVFHPCSTVPRFPPLSHGATFSSFSFSHFQRPLAVMYLISGCLCFI